MVLTYGKESRQLMRRLHQRRRDINNGIPHSAKSGCKDCINFVTSDCRVCLNFKTSTQYRIITINPTFDMCNHCGNNKRNSNNKVHINPCTTHQEPWEKEYL